MDCLSIVRLSQLHLDSLSLQYLAKAREWTYQLQKGASEWLCEFDCLQSFCENICLLQICCNLVDLHVIGLLVLPEPMISNSIMLGLRWHTAWFHVAKCEFLVKLLYSVCVE